MKKAIYHLILYLLAGVTLGLLADYIFSTFPLLTIIIPSTGMLVAILSALYYIRKGQLSQ